MSLALTFEHSDPSISLLVVLYHNVKLGVSGHLNTMLLKAQTQLFHILLIDDGRLHNQLCPAITE